MMAWFVLCLVAALFSGPCQASFPPSAFDCQDMKPTEMFSIDPQVLPSPFKIYVEKKVYNTRDRIKVNLTDTGTSGFQAFMIQALRISPELNQIEPIGYFTDNPVTEEHCHGNVGVGLRSADTGQSMSDVTLTWKAPDSFQGHVEFRVTFIKNKAEYWLKEKSTSLIDPTAPPLPTARTIPDIMPLIPPINTADCGIIKGCYREPMGCWEPYCQYIVTWRDKDDVVEFEIGAQTDGLDDRYVAVGLSEDIRMGGDAVMDCVHNSEAGRVEVYLSYNDDNAKKNKRLPLPQNGIVHQEGSHYDGRLRCRFTRKKFVDGDTRVIPLTGGSWHLLVARGYASRGKIHRHGLGVGELPISSRQRVSLQTFANIHGRARFPLVKAHGCLMIFAFIFCANIGLLWAKYYKPMWPNSRLYGSKYWFVAHRLCLSTTFIVVIIAFILIFIEAGGYSQAPDLPQKAHPILGIIIFVCVLINPILALLRCNDDDKNRPIFNWFHWAFGTIANVLAIPNIFIGMDFGKANVPWWATWILVAYVIFHIIVEVMLEVHMCVTHKKNKERREKYEIMKKERPHEKIPYPNPVGHNFKRNTLYVHFTVTLIVALLMILIVAIA